MNEDIYRDTLRRFDSLATRSLAGEMHTPEICRSGRRSPPAMTKSATGMCPHPRMNYKLMIEATPRDWPPKPTAFRETGIRYNLANHKRSLGFEPES